MAMVDFEPSSMIGTPTIGSAGIVSDTDFFAEHFGATCKDASQTNGGYNPFFEAMNGGMDFSASESMPESLTPPPSAKKSPMDWAQQSEHLHKHNHPTLANLDTSTFNEEFVRFDHGQWTPPDDVVSPQTAQYNLSAARHAQQIKQEEADSVDPLMAERKRSSASDTVSEPSQAPKKRRSRKNASVSAVSEQSADPVEEEKRSKFLERNRVAASKCRQKKKEWTQSLEGRARDLQASNLQYRALATSLRDEVLWLKGEMLKHTECGCAHIREYLAREAENIASGNSRTPGTPASRISFGASHEEGQFSSLGHESWRSARSSLSHERPGSSATSQYPDDSTSTGVLDDRGADVPTELDPAIA